MPHLAPATGVGKGCVIHIIFEVFEKYDSLRGCVLQYCHRDHRHLPPAAARPGLSGGGSWGPGPRQSQADQNGFIVCHIKHNDIV